MAEETITIAKLQVQTEGAESIGDLRENVKLLKKYLDEATIGTEDYQQALDLLKVNQNALKDAMYATSSSLEDVKKSATGTGESYNALVHRMAALKEEFRSTDDAMRRMDLGGQINEINDKLKEMDALQGNFQRNVGNYAGGIKSAFGDMSKNVDVFRKSLTSVGSGLNGVKDGMEGISKSPAIATFGILVSIAIKLANELKDNETAMAAMKKAMESLKPVMDFFSGLLENIATILADLITKVVEFVSSNGLIQKIIQGVMGIGNAVLQFVIAPFKGVIAAIKVFKEQGVKGIGDAAKAFGQEMKSGVAFKQNFRAGQVAAETIISGAKSKKKEVKDAGVEIGKELSEGVGEGLQDVMKILSDLEKKQEEERKRILSEQKELDALVEEEYQSTIAQIDAYFEEEQRLREQDLKDAEAKAKAKKALLAGVADATASILDSIADYYESDEQNSTKNAQKIKALRIASATIDTISGAIGAYMQAAATIPPPLGQITGAIQAAAITAAGVAQIAKMRSTKIGGSAGGGGEASVPVVAPAPVVETNVPNVRSVTSATEEERLNQMASDQRVYILASDIEASQNQRRTQVAETSF